MKEIEFDESTFYIGQNCSENDKLFKTMPQDATWFHLDSLSSSHVYCIKKEEFSNKKLTKEEIKKGAELVKVWSKKTDKVIYIKKSKLKRIGPGLVELLDDPKYA
jgi:hypothetical protein